MMTMPVHPELPGVPDPATSTDFLALALDAKKAHARLAREDPSEFNGYVLKDPSGRALTQAKLHRIWHALANRHKRLMIWSHVEAGKTTQLAIGRVLWELGRNPNLRVCIVSNTQEQATKSLLTIAKIIERDDDLREVFPHLKPGDPWTNSKLHIDRNVISRDPSVQAIGVHGNILGARIDLLILDDILDHENTRTPQQRLDLWQWYHSTLAGRLTQDARVWCIGNAWHPEDFMHRIEHESTIWSCYRFPVIDDTGRVLWPEQWPPARIEAKRLELAGDPASFARSMLCKARDDTDARFKQEWINLCSSQGVGKKLVPDLNSLFAGTRGSIAELPRGYKAFTGVDLASQRHQAAGKVVCFTGLIHPDGKRQPIGIESGRWSGQEILDKMESHHRRYRSILVIENNAAQEFMRQFASTRALPTVPFTTGRNKANPEFGVESIAAELARGEWIIPCDETAPGKYRYHPEIGMWLQDMLFYDPTAHTGDHLMASWFFREGERKTRGSVKRMNIDLMTR